MLDWSLTTGGLPLVITGLGAIAGFVLLLGRGRRWRIWRLPLALAVGFLAGFGAIVVVDVWWRPFPDPLPPVVAVCIGVVAAAASLVVRPGGWRARTAAVGAVVLVALAGAVQVNQFFGAYPTLRSAVGLPPSDEVALSQVPRLASAVVVAERGRPLSWSWRAPADLPRSGAFAAVSIVGGVSGFRARPAWVYLPPAYLSTPRAELPVLVLMAGQPGSPRDWLDGGRLATTMNQFAAAHGGLAPVVVVADPLGTELGRTLCVDSRSGNSYTYLTVDVPAWIRANLQVDTAPEHWVVGGLSAGGTCALQLAVNAPAVYPTFLDISGQEEPTVGSRARTVAELFDGDPAAFRRVNPLDVLATRRFSGSAGFIVAGRDDSIYRPQARKVLAAAQSAAMDVRYLEIPGGHSWRVWASGLEQALPWLAVRTNLVA
jgi:S-formylglutathione hydrolase FrmB